jgi:hypothetical protein
MKESDQFFSCNSGNAQMTFHGKASPDVYEKAKEQSDKSSALAHALAHHGHSCDYSCVLGQMPPHNQSETSPSPKKEVSAYQNLYDALYS